MTSRAAVETIMDPPQRVRTLRGGLDTLTRGIEPLVDLCRPYVDGLANLPRDGRFLIVGNHTGSGWKARSSRISCAGRSEPGSDR